MCKMKLEKVNLILAVFALCLGVYCAYLASQKKGGEEYYAELNDMSCDQLQQAYCNLMKTGRMNNLGDGARRVLYNAMMKCGKDAHLDMDSCYPSWATRRGGTHDYPFYPQITSVEPVYDTPVIIPSAPQQVGTSVSSTSGITIQPPSPPPIAPVFQVAPVQQEMPSSPVVPTPIAPVIPLAPSTPSAPLAPTGLNVQSPMGGVLSGITSFDKSTLRPSSAKQASSPVQSDLEASLSNIRKQVSPDEDWETYQYLY